MSSIKVIFNKLTNNAPLVEVVPAARIMAGALPQGIALPAIGLTHVSTVRRNLVRKGSTEYCTSRVQVTILAETYDQQRTVLALIRTALPRTRATVNGVAVDDILLELEGPDFRNEEATIYMQSLDYSVTWNE